MPATTLSLAGRLAALAGLACLALLSSAAPNPPLAAGKLEKRGTPADEIIQLTSSTNFCLILPPEPYVIIPDREYDAVSYCLPSGNITSTGNRTIPAGFITAANFVRTSGGEFVQISGTYDPPVFGLFANDTGGQYDSDGIGCGAKGCPKGATCAGYPHFIEIIGSSQFCVRCCMDVTFCPDTRDTEGCKNLMGGNYSTGFTDSVVPVPNNGTALPYIDPPPPMSKTTTASKPTAAPTATANSTASNGTTSSPTAAAINSTSSNSTAGTKSAAGRNVAFGWTAVAAGVVVALVQVVLA